MDSISKEFSVLDDTVEIKSKDKDDEIIERLSNLTGVNYSDEQIAIMKHHGGMAIMAAAGSGKTTVLTHLLAKRIMSGEISDTTKVLCTTYSKAGADEMEDRINKLLERAGIKRKVLVKTMHAFYLMILQQFGYNMRLVDNFQRLRFIREACTAAEVKLDDDDLATLDGLLSYQVNNLMSDKMLLDSYVYTIGEKVPRDKYAKIHAEYNELKKKAGMMDFDDMQLYIYFWLYSADDNTKKLVTDYIKASWTDFYVDEAQDISKIQMAILRKMCTDSDKIVFIGDDDQCIYEWRGADPSLLINITGYYDIQRFILSTNYRCRSEIVERAAEGIKFNTRRTNKTMTPFNKGGDIRIIDASDRSLSGNDYWSGRSNSGMVAVGGKEIPDLYRMTKYAFMYIRDLVKSGVSPSDIAVLSRNNNQLSILNNMLFRDGIFCTYAKDMRLTGNAMYRELKQVVLLARDDCSPSLTRGILWKVVPYLGTKNAAALASFQESSGFKFSDLLGFFLTECCDRDIGWKMPSGASLPVSAKVQLRALARQLNSSQADNLKIMYKATVYAGSKAETEEQRKIDNDFKKIANYFGLYKTVSMDFLYRTEDKQRTFVGYLEYFKDLVREWGIDKTLRFFNVVEQYENGTVAVYDNKINMSTMHGAKGKEWPYVVLFADDNITFPNFRSIVDLQNRRVKNSDIVRTVEEDRRLHYVAVTRAKTNLTIVTYKNNVSVYMLEALGILDKGSAIANNNFIVNIASTGELPRDIINELNSKVFNPSSKYYLNIDISKIDHDTAIEFNGAMATEDSDQKLEEKALKRQQEAAERRRNRGKASRRDNEYVDSSGRDIDSEDEDYPEYYDTSGRDIDSDDESDYEEY